MKEQLARLEKELNSARVQGHEVNCQATAVYVNLSRTINEVYSYNIASYSGHSRLFHTASDKSLGWPEYEARRLYFDITFSKGPYLSDIT